MKKEKQYYLTLKIPVVELFGLWADGIKHQLEYAIDDKKTKKEIIADVKKVLKLFK